MARSIRLNNANEWTQGSPRQAARRGTAAAAGMQIDPRFLKAGVTIEEEIDAEPVAARRAAGVPMADISVQPEKDELYTLAIRHPSGAITFHGPDAGAMQRSARRSTRAAAPEIRFRVPLPAALPPPAAGARRGAVGAAFKFIVLKVAGKLINAAADALLPVLAERVEKALWANRSQGWLRVDEPGLAANNLRNRIPDGVGPSGSALLFIHGTFSTTASAFGPLANSGFFAKARQLYGEHIYAFDHFTVSKSPEENARELLQALPKLKQLSFDVITHSRGGLVLRNIVERPAAFAASARRFRLNRAVLVASPNEGTPLATPEHWEKTIGWIANLIELFPDNPLTFATGFVAEAIVWIAQRAAGALPGLASMDQKSEQVAGLQNRFPGGDVKYAALVANSNPDTTVVARMIDVGIDAFFGGANDLVVPSEGGWRVHGTDRKPAIGGTRIGCYGLGGNIAGGEVVHHLNFFRQKEAIAFVIEELTNVRHELLPIDPDMTLPTARLRRANIGTADPIVARPVAKVGTAAPPRPKNDPAEVPSMPATLTLQRDLSPVYSEAFQITFLDPRLQVHDGGATAPAQVPAKPAKHTAAKKLAEAEAAPTPSGAPLQLLATYAGARIVEPFIIDRGSAKDRWQKITDMHERMKRFVDGELGFDTPTEEELVEYGTLLFMTMFPPEVRRLYDVARSRETRGPLNVIFTSMIPDVADKPWEFAFDPDRKTYLATQELHFVRNALTAIPVEVVHPRTGPLRILVAVAQPIGTVPLGSEREESVIRRSFQPMIDAGLAEITVLRSTTPGQLHRWLMHEAYDVVHFVGHGEFRRNDDGGGQGFLLFEDDRGGIQRISARSLCEILCQRGIRLVFLNACETGRGEAEVVGKGRKGQKLKADFNRGVAQALVANGLPAVVANQFSVRDDMATEFSQHFYWSLAQGSTFGSAAREARIAVNYSTDHGGIDFAIPVVYARDPESRICTHRSVTLDEIKAPLVASSARSATANHELRIAIWDINHIFPDLQHAVEQMNAAQSSFGFEIVDMSVPIGAWQRYDGVLQLNADLAAQSLANKQRELGVDYLFCIIDKPITYTDEEGVTNHNYYNWWPGRDGEKVLFYQAPEEHLLAKPGAGDLAIANAVVQGLTGVLADAGTHERGPKDCPLYLNEEIDRRLDTAPQHFHKSCEARLKKKISKFLPSLKSLLALFVEE